MGLYVCGLLLIIEQEVDANCGETHEFYDWHATPTIWRPKGAILWPPMQFMKDIPKPLETKGPYACLFLFPHLLPGLVFQLWRFELS